jgi:hypothetical protein
VARRKTSRAAQLTGTTLEFVYELGEAHDLDALELAPTLVALSTVIREANRIVNPNGPDLVVRIKPFRPGSFDIVSIIQSAPPEAQMFLGGSAVLTAKKIYNVLKKLGLVEKGVKGLLQVIEILKGRPTEIKPTNNGVTITASNGAQVTVNKEIGQLFQNSHITQNIYHIYAPIERGSSQTVNTYVPEVSDSKVTVTAESIPALKDAASAPPLPAANEVTTERIVQAALHPKRGSFDTDGSSWSFKWGDQVITASVKDRLFLKRYDAGEVRLNGHDTLHVSMVERQKSLGDVVQSRTYEITAVNNYTPGLTQPKLDLEVE